MHPHLFQFGHFILPAFGALLALGTILAFLVCLRVARLLSLDTDKVSNLALMAIAIALGGARILVTAAYWPRYGARAFAVSLAGSGWAQFAGIAMAIVVCSLYARKAGLPIRRTADALAPALAVVSAAAAVGCFEAGYGYGTPTRASWAVMYRGPFVAPGTPVDVPLHPTELYIALMEFALFVGLLWLLRRPHANGEVMGAWLYLGGIGRFFFAFLRGDSRTLGGALTASQWIAVGMVLAGGALWLRGVGLRRRSRHAAGGKVHYAG